MPVFTRRRFFAGSALVLTTVVIWPFVRAALAPSVPEPSPAALRHRDNVEILRDAFGVPHVFGISDADAAFGLAYAHAEDDWPMLQGVMAASRGELGRVLPGSRGFANDYYAAFVGVEDEIEATYPSIAPDLEAVFDGYAEGLNYYAAMHPDEVEARLLPVNGRDVARGFVHKLPLMMKVNLVMKALNEGVDDVEGFVFPGSNAHAVHRTRSTDDVTRLNINAHQPWSGPVTFYEAHVHSEEGWNTAGALFPGAPMILAGHNDHIGWAMTVNKPDGVDLYELDVEGDTYAYGDGRKTLETRRIWLPLETPWLTAWIPQTLSSSVHGPVFDKGKVPTAIKNPASGHGIGAAEQWFRMNKADSAEAFLAALDMNHIPMFNIVWAARDDIGWRYNARIPERTPGFDYKKPLPGNKPDALWTDVIDPSALPALTNPELGYVQACNSTPWAALPQGASPEKTPILADAGIEDVVTNRTLRTHEIMQEHGLLSRDDFLAMKWDPGVAQQAPMRTKLLNPLQTMTFDEPELESLRQTLLAWDGRFVSGSKGAAVAALAWRPLTRTGDNVLDEWDLRSALRRTADHLDEHFGGQDVVLEDVQRLRRGDVDLPLVGGPDILHCTYGDLMDDGRLVGDNGDGFVMLVEFAESEVRSWSVHQFGGATARPDNPHYASQAPLFVKKLLKPVFRDRPRLERTASAVYRPGDTWTAKPVDADATLKRLDAVAAE